MPRYLAYICPRTDKLFKEKSDYVAHLRVLAKASRKEKRIDRELKTIRDSFAVLRMRATSDISILKWLVTNSTEIIRVCNIITPSSASNLAKMGVQSKSIVVEERVGRLTSQIAIGKQVDTEMVLPFKPRDGYASLVGASVAFVASMGGHNTFLDAARVVLSLLPGVSVGGHAKRQSLRMALYAEDWPFVAGLALFDFRRAVGSNNETDYSLARVMEKRYPQLTFEGYETVCKSSFFDDDELGELAFLNWLRHGSEAALTLPALSHENAPGGPVLD